MSVRRGAPKNETRREMGWGWDFLKVCCFREVCFRFEWKNIFPMLVEDTARNSCFKEQWGWFTIRNRLLGHGYVLPHPPLAQWLCPGSVGSFLLVGDHIIVKYITVECVLNQWSLYFLFMTSSMVTLSMRLRIRSGVQINTITVMVIGSSRRPWETDISVCTDMH